MAMCHCALENTSFSLRESVIATDHELCDHDFWQCSVATPSEVFERQVRYLDLFQRLF